MSPTNKSKSRSSPVEKASSDSPKKHKVMKHKHSPVKHASPNKNSHRIYVTSVKGDANTEYLLAEVKKGNVEEGVTVFPIIKKLRKHKSFKNKAQIDLIATVRDSSGENRPMKQAPKSEWDQKCFLRWVQPGQNTPDTRRQWGGNLVKCFNEVGQDVDPFNKGKFHFQVTYVYAGDVTPPALLPLSHYILNEQIIMLIQKKYPTLTLEEIAQDDEVISTYFGPDNVEHYRSLLLASNQSSSASSSSSSDNDA